MIAAIMAIFYNIRKFIVGNQVCDARAFEYQHTSLLLLLVKGAGDGI
jgi:hypothetical protein